EPSAANGSEITVTPYNADLGEPSLRLLEPANGDTVKERTLLTALVEMQNLEEASVQFLLGGEENNPLNPAAQTLSQPDKATVRVPVVFDVPAVSGSMAAVIRLISDGHIRSQVFINIEDDEVLGSQPVLVTEPSAQLLAGTDLSFQAYASPAIDDQDSTSFVQQQGMRAPLTFAFGEEQLLQDVQPVDAGAPDVSLLAHLQDRSGNNAETSKVLSILPYFSADEELWLTLRPGLERLQSLQYSTALGLVAVINNAYGGFRVVTRDQGSFTQAQGTASALQLDGSRAYIAYNEAGERKLLSLQWQNSAATRVGDWLFDAGLTAVNGDVIFGRAGNSVLAYQMRDAYLVSLAGYTTSDLVSVQWADGRLWALTETALIELSLSNDSGLIGLREVNRFNLDTYQGMAVVGEQFAFYSGNNLYHYQLVAGALESRGSFSATQRILSVQADRSGWWLQLADGRWIAVQDNQQTALWLRPQQLQVAPQFVGYLADNGVYTRELITQSVAGPVVTQTLAATGYLLRAERALTLAAYTQNGEQLTLFRQGSAEWLLPYVQNLTQIELSYTDVTGEGKVLLALDQPVAAGTVSVAPASATLAVNGLVPVTLTPAADSQLVLLNAQNGVPLAPVADLGWQQWLSVIAQNDLSWTMDGNNLSASWSGTDNQSQG